MGATPSKQQRRLEPEPSWMPAYNGTVFPMLATNMTSCDAPPPPPSPSGGDGASSPPPPPPAQGESSGDEQSKDNISEAAKSVTAYVNPGPYEQATADVKRYINVDTYDGFRCDITRQLSPQMAVVHNFVLGTTMLPEGKTYNYSWIAQVADETSFCMARVDPSSWSTDGRIHKALLGGLALFKLQLGLSPGDGSSDQAMAEIDLNAPSFTVNLKYGSVGGGVIYGLNYYQSITDRLSMGGEGVFIGANQSLGANYVLKYQMPAKGEDDDIDSNTGTDILDRALAADGKSSSQPTNWNNRPSSLLCASLDTTQGSLTLGYRRIVSPNRVTLAAELNSSLSQPLGQIVLGAEFQFARSKLKCSVDGTGRMQSVLESKLGKEPGQPTLSLSADVDHLQQQMRFGYGLTMEG